MIKKIYVAATSQHVGKTTSTLGLVAAFRDLGLNVGYCKPVGQEFVELEDLKVDKDALLFSTVMHFDLASEVHSPVILGRGATTAYLDNPADFQYRERIQKASEILESQYEMVVYEGTGHPGVGSVVNLSNAEVAELLDAGVVMIVEGGIGKTIDKLMMSIALFQQKNIPIIGVIVNKVLPNKIDKVKNYVEKKLTQEGLKLLGVLPFEKNMSNPIMLTINDAVKGKVLLNPHNLDNEVDDIVSGSLIELNEFPDSNNLLLIVSNNRLERTMAKVELMMAQKEDDACPLSGIIITGDDHNLTEFYDLAKNSFIQKYKIPVIATQFDTFGAVVKISKIEVKINTRTPWKTKKAIEMIKNNVDLDYILKKK